MAKREAQTRALVLAQAGLTTSDIAAQLGVDYCSVKRWCKRAGVPLRTPRTAAQESRKAGEEQRQGKTITKLTHAELDELERKIADERSRNGAGGRT